ncbi:MAG: SelB C-terminal domain-containing protein [Spirochaetes bacterium]|nr:SelB C-terminal domain-containing protein [Spirochaetota bacterium]
MFPSGNIVVHTLKQLVQTNIITVIGEYIATASCFNAAVSLCKDAAKRSIPFTEITQKHAIPLDVLQHIAKEYNLVKKEKEEIGDSEKEFLLQVLKKGIEGINPKDFPHNKNIIDPLIKTGHLIVIDRELLWHKEVFSDYCSRIMAHFAANKELTVQQAKELTGLSRKYVIPLLNAMEQKNLLKRYGDVRMKV